MLWIKKPFKTEAANYSLYGGLFGLCFPLIAGIVDCLHHFGELSLEGIWVRQRDNPLEWIIDSAPFWLGLFARFGGIRQDRINEYAHSLEHKISERTNQLAQANETIEAANRHLKANQQQLESIIDHLPAVFFSKNPEGQYLMVNRRFKEAIGISKESVIGQTDREIFPPNIAEEIEKIDQRTFSRNKSVTFEERMPHPDGTLHNYLTTRLPLINEQGQTTSLISMATDITQLKVLQEDLAHAKMLAETANQTKDKFFSIISHDLRGPIGSLSVMYNDILQSPADLDQDIFNATRQATKRTDRMLNNLLDWARSQSGHMQPQPIHFDLYQPMAEMRDFLSAQAQQKQIQISLMGKNEFYIYADPCMVTTVIRNLLSNAIKFTPLGGRIEMGVEIQKQMTRFYIRDTGQGISTEILEKLFKIGEKIDSSLGTVHESGAGLGLIMCKEFVEKNQGHIGVESQLGKGSCFWFEVPSGQKQEQSRVNYTNCLEKLDGLQCLLVDDDPLHLKTSEQVLLQLGLAHETATNGAEALRQMSEKPAQLVLLDIDRPVNPIDTLAQIREQSPTQPIIIALSSYQEQQMVPQVGTSQFDAYLEKPLELAKFLASLKMIFALE